MSDDRILKILLVGSDELVWDSMKMYFETIGFEVSMASTAEEALGYRTPPGLPGPVGCRAQGRGPGVSGFQRVQALGQIAGEA